MESPSKDLIKQLNDEARVWYLNNAKSQTDIVTMRFCMYNYMRKRLLKMGYNT